MSDLVFVRLFAPVLLCLVFVGVGERSTHAAIIIDFEFDLSSNPYDQAGDTTLSAGNQAIFSDAGDFWENIITGYADGATRTVTIFASGFSQAASGGSILLGSAGPRTGLFFNANGDQFVTTADGSARFNVNVDAVGAGGLLDPLTIRHEIGHVLGFGTWWPEHENNPLLEDLYVSGSGQYFGENALEAYRNEFDPGANFVPVELEGGPGTADGHWNEGNFPELTVLSGPNAGLNLDDELMTGNLSGSGFVGDVTLGGLRDLGFTTIAYRATAVPEPSALVWMVVGPVVLGLRRRSKNSKESQ